MKFSQIVIYCCIVCPVFFLAPVQVIAQDLKPKGLGNTLTAEQWNAQQKLSAKPQPVTETPARSKPTGSGYDATIEKRNAEVAALKLEAKKQADLAEAKLKLTAVSQNGKWGFADINGKIIIPIIYDDYKPGWNGYYAVKSGNKWGFITKTSAIILKFEYDDVLLNFSAPPDKDLYGYVNTPSTPDLPVAVVVQNYEEFSINPVGQLVGLKKRMTPKGYDEVGYFADGLAIVSKKGKYGLINEKMELVLPVIYEEKMYNNEGIILLKLNNKYGYADATGKIIIPFKYDFAESFYGNKVLAWVKLNNKWGEINRLGEEIVPFKYDDRVLYWGLRCAIKLNDKWGLSDRFGVIKIEPKYDKMIVDDHGNILVEVNKKFGLIDTTNIEVIEPIYDTIVNYPYYSVSTVKLNNKWGLLDHQGNEIVEIKYEDKCDYLDIRFAEKNPSWGTSRYGSQILPLLNKKPKDAIALFIYFKMDDKFYPFNYKGKRLSSKLVKSN